MKDDAQAQPVGVTPKTIQKDDEKDLPPVVARMVVEVRSDGSRTIARGAIEDLTTNERVAIRADGTTPLQLASALAKSLVRTPVFARQAIKSLLTGRRRGR